MDPMRVGGHNWPDDESLVGGWVFPHGELLDYWTVTAVHARFAAPALYAPWTDLWGRPWQVRRRKPLLAYHVDLKGRFALPDRPDMLLYQVPPNGQWMLRDADEERLSRYEQYRAG